MTRESFTKGMALLGEVFPERFSGMDKGRLEIWFRLLGDLKDKEWEKGILYIIRNNNKAPSISTIRKTAKEYTFSLSGEEAWLEVTEAVRSQGYASPPTFNDLALQKAVNALGWLNICECRTDNLGILRAQFFRVYEAMRKREETNRELLAIEQDEGVKLLGD